MFHSRFYSQDIADSPGFVSVLLVSLTDGIDVVDAGDPFVLCEFYLADEVVEVFYQRAKDFSVSRFCLWGHKTDDMFCEVWVVLGGSSGSVAVNTVGSHGQFAMIVCRIGRD